MRLLFATLGTFGDVAPLIALARALCRRGHQALFLVPRALEQYVDREVFEVAPFGPESAESLALMRSELLAAVDSSRSRDEGVRQSLLQDACRAFEAVASRVDAIVRSHNLPAEFAEANGASLPQVVVCASDPAYMTIRDEGSSGESPVVAGLYAFSPKLAPRERGWPANHHVTGFLFEDGTPFEPEPELVRFLEAGPAPIVVTFGSMVHQDPQRVARLVSGAAADIGARVVVQRGWSGLTDDTVPEHALFVERLPEAWLFERARCVIHHAGAGTTGTALRAGVPSVLVPHAFDQFAVSRRLLRLGYVRAVVPFRELNADALAGALAMTIDDAELRERLVVLARELEQESGVRTAIRIIEEATSGLC